MNVQRSNIDQNIFQEITKQKMNGKLAKPRCQFIHQEKRRQETKEDHGSHNHHTFKLPV